MTFVARPPAPGAEPPSEDEAAIAGDGFFPDIDPAFVRETARVPPASVTSAALRAAILAAMITVDKDVQAWATAQITAGYATLAAVPARQLGDESVLVHAYKRAVALYAKAELIDRMPDFDLTAAGGARAEDAATAIGGLRRDAQHAVRDLVGRTRTTVDLI